MDGRAASRLDIMGCNLLLEEYVTGWNVEIPCNNDYVMGLSKCDGARMYLVAGNYFGSRSLPFRLCGSVCGSMRTRA